jgi:tellurite resistance protein
MRKRCRPWLPVRSWRSRHVKPVERDELLNFIEQQGFAPDTAKGDIRELFDSRLRQLEDRHTLDTIIHALRPLAGLSLSSTVVRTAERIAMADRDLHPSELEALNVIRRLLAGSANRDRPNRG